MWSVARYYDFAIGEALWEFKNQCTITELVSIGHMDQVKDIQYALESIVGFTGCTFHHHTTFSRNTEALNVTRQGVGGLRFRAKHHELRNT